MPISCYQNICCDQICFNFYFKTPIFQIKWQIVSFFRSLHALCRCATCNCDLRFQKHDDVRARSEFQSGTSALSKLLFNDAAPNYHLLGMHCIGRVHFLYKYLRTYYIVPDIYNATQRTKSDAYQQKYARISNN